MSRLSDALELFRNGPALLKDAIGDATDADTQRIPAPGKWTIRQIVRHVADTEIVVGMRLRQTIAENSPTLIPFDQEAWADNLGYADAPVAPSLELFRALRDDTASLLESLPGEAFNRPGVHPERGTKSLLDWVEIFAVHVRTHASQIRNIRA